MFPDNGTERAPVTREAVVDAALDLLAEGGLEAVSFRRIAKVLGVSGPTLYWHVENKRQLMDLMADELVRRTGRSYAGPEPGQPWWEWLRADARRMFDALVATRDAPRVLAGNRPSPDSFADIERVLGDSWSAAGMTPGQAQQTLFAIGAYVIGSATEWQAEAEREKVQPLPDPADEELNALPGGVPRRPAGAARRDRRAAGRPHSATFEFGLDLLVAGLRARLRGVGRDDRVGTGSAMTTDDTRKVAELLKGERFGFLTTITIDGRLTSRPMTLQEVEFDGDLWFFAERDSTPVAARHRVAAGERRRRLGRHLGLADR